MLAEANLHVIDTKYGSIHRDSKCAVLGHLPSYLIVVSGSCHLCNNLETKTCVTLWAWYPCWDKSLLQNLLFVRGASSFHQYWLGYWICTCVIHSNMYHSGSRSCLLNNNPTWYKIKKYICSCQYHVAGAMLTNVMM